MKKEKQPSLDLIRAVSIIAILLEHFSFSYLQFNIPGKYIPFLKFANGDWGGTFVAVFFMISGAALIYNYPTFVREGESGFVAQLKGVLRFYWKRIITIYPLFYFCWVIFYYLTSKSIKLWNWGGDWSNLWYTVFGVDGYFLHRHFNYFCVGEWFLGAIIILYLLFPLVRFCFMRLRWPSTAILTALFLLNMFRFKYNSLPNTNIFIVLIKWYDSVIEVPDSRNIITCLMYFWLGMLLITYRKRLLTCTMAIISLVLMLIMAAVPLPVYYNEIILDGFCAMLIFIMLGYIAPMVMKYAPVKKSVLFIGKYSYCMFLIHHQILYLIMPRFTGVTFNYFTSLLLFIAFTLIVLILSFILTEIVNAVMNIVMHPVKSYNRLVKRIGAIKK